MFVILTKQNIRGVCVGDAQWKVRIAPKYESTDRKQENEGRLLEFYYNKFNGRNANSDFVFSMKIVFKNLLPANKSKLIQK